MGKMGGGLFSDKTRWFFLDNFVIDASVSSKTMLRRLMVDYVMVCLSFSDEPPNIGGCIVFRNTQFSCIGLRGKRQAPERRILLIWENLEIWLRIHPGLPKVLYMLFISG